MFKPLFTPLLAAASLAATFASIHAQVKRPECEGPCRIRMEHITTISDATAPDKLSVVHAVAVDSRNRILITSRHSTSQIDVFDFVGRFVRSIGRDGEGPGEFRDINLIVPVKDRIHVFDQGNIRRTVLDSGLDIIEQQPLPQRALGAAVWKDSLILNAAIPTGERGGYTLHVVSGESTVQRSFAHDTVAMHPDIPYASERELSVCPGSGDLFAAEKRRYRITRYGVSTPPVHISRNASWFAPHFRAPRFQPDDGAPPPIIRAIRCDGQDLLWVIITVADENWREGLRPAPAGPHGPNRYVADDRDRYFDTVIEVLDPETGHVVAAGRTDYYIGFFPAENVVASYRESEEGRPSLVLWRVAF